MNIFEERESNVRSYCRSFPAVFERAKGSLLYSESGEAYTDFLAGAGALNYGHNNEEIKGRIVEYLLADGVTHALDLHTTAKRRFLEKFSESILRPRNLDYKVQFCGPTGTNAVEAALKLARKVKRRPGIFSFMGGYHGVSLGSLAATGGMSHRAASGVPLNNVTFMPYPHGFMAGIDTNGYIEAVLKDGHSGVEKPAAVILETVQAEGGVVVAPVEWLQGLRRLCDEHDILLICDDIQVGCGRAGGFFSFERAGIVPDMVTLSKSISGNGSPMSLLLLKPELDAWEPAEHTGTFRGYQLAFVGAAAALEFREKHNLEEAVKAKAAFIEDYLTREIAPLAGGIEIRGLGMIWGIDLAQAGGAALARRVARRCFDLGLIVERVGRDDTVLKLLPPLTIETELLEGGCAVIKRALEECLAGGEATPEVAPEQQGVYVSG